MRRPLRMAMVGGGPGAFIGAVHRICLALDGEFELVAGAERSVRIVDLRDQPRCERSWKRDGTVRERSDGGMLSDRDAATLGLA